MKQLKQLRLHSFVKVSDVLNIVNKLTDFTHQTLALDFNCFGSEIDVKMYAQLLNVAKKRKENGPLEIIMRYMEVDVPPGMLKANRHLLRIKTS